MAAVLVAEDDKDKPTVVSKRHILREHMTTRRLYPGRRDIEIQVNGKVYAKRSFEVE